MIKNVGMHPGASEAVNTSESFSRLDSDSRGVATMPQRKNIRAEFHDYSGGEYFITICTRDKVHYFGKIVPNVCAHGPSVQMHGTDYPCVQNVGTHGPCVRGYEMDAPSVPNVCAHGPCVQRHEMDDPSVQMYRMEFTIIGEYCYQQLNELSLHYPYAEIPLFVVMPNHIHAIIRINNNRTHEPCVPTKRTALSVVIGGLKRAVTMYARRNDIEFGWQSRYHDHIIRGMRDGNRIYEYILNNVDRWGDDCFYR